MHGALQLRFSLLGGVFDAIQRGNLSLTDTWVLLLAQLVTNGVVTLYNNRSEPGNRPHHVRACSERIIALMDVF